MTPRCPVCRRLLALGTGGEYQCEGCRSRFSLSLVLERPLEPPAAPGDPSGACARHPAAAAMGVCDRCGDFMCAVCETPMEGRRYCPGCFDILFERAGFAFQQQNFTLPKTAFDLGAASLILGWTIIGGLTLGVAAVASGVAALKEIGRRPALAGGRKATVGIGLGIAGLMLAVVTTIVGVLAIRQS